MTNRLAARITSAPRIMMDKPVPEGTRIPVELILRHLGAGDSEQQILPALKREKKRVQAHSLIGPNIKAVCCSKLKSQRDQQPLRRQFWSNSFFVLAQ